MTDLVSALYVGHVVHRRIAPRRHRLRYALFQVLLDLNEIPELARRMRLFSHNRFNVFSFHDRDHGDGRTGPLRDYVRDLLIDAGIDIGAGGIKLLCMPRLFGHVFNPISLYFCHAEDGRLAAMLYEVTNTYKERHSYLILVNASDEPVIRQSCRKALFVSPFMDMDMAYEFTVGRPGETISTTVRGRSASGDPMIVATFRGRRETLTDGALATALATHPFLTLKVVAAIHWEAVKLLIKGLKLRPHPPAPARLVSVASFAAAPESQNHQTISLSA